MQILHLAARGMGNKEVTYALYLSETTVKRNLSNTYDKLGISSRGEAVSEAVSEGWISSWNIARDE